MEYPEIDNNLKIRDIRNKDFFIVNHSIFTDLSISNNSRLIYCFLCHHVDYQSQTVKYSIRYLMRFFHLGYCSIINSINELIKFKYISGIGKTRGGWNIIYLLDVSRDKFSNPSQKQGVSAQKQGVSAQKQGVSAQKHNRDIINQEFKDLFISVKKYYDDGETVFYKTKKNSSINNENKIKCQDIIKKATGKNCRIFIDG